MQNFKKDGFKKQGGFGDRKPFGKPSFGGKSDFKKKSWDSKPKSFDDRTMHTTTCSGCQKSCQVPFVPAPGKPVFCDDCFVKTRNGENPIRNNPQSTYNNRDTKFASVQPSNDVVARQLQVIAGKLDVLIDLITRKELSQKISVEDNSSIPEITKTDAPKKTSITKIVKPVAVKKVIVKKVAKSLKKK
jgi:CxxC-x17-CxxC domain-containing protein